MSSHRFFITGGMGNTLFQIAHILKFYGDNDVQLIRLIYQDTFLTRMLGWSVHSELIATKGFQEHQTKFIDLIALALLFLKRKINPSADVSISIRNLTWHFGYYQAQKDCDYCSITNSISKYIKIHPSYEALCLEDKVLSNSCVIHVRKGDFLDNMTIDNTYYLKIIRNLTCTFDRFIFVGVGASMVLKFVKSNGINNVYLAKKNDETYDYNLIYYSNHIIASNSTFCFWPIILGVKKTVYISDTKAPWPFKKVYEKLSNVEVVKFE